ncbi:putative MFS multidrug resistance transporter [Penicillium brasilianum]|uniref:Putative MFS multidrug resistance transporter n=1 Tax=Penicillium brasilianum TaxID=104259 RepID=A0A1S9RP96_PENBI|nr:putative MFS multidrug resistance transporter [Penicillium brasilianum]
MPAGIEKDDAVMSGSSPSSPSNDHSLATIEGPFDMDNANSRSHASSVVAGDEEKNISETPIPLARQTTELGPAVKVPRLKRRGLFGQMTLVAEVEDPKTYPRKMKWFITFIVAVAGATAPMGSSVFFPSLSQVARELHTTATIANLSIALYMLSMSIFPLWWSSFSERLGRRTIYLVSFVLFVMFNCLCAVSSSIAMLIVMRMLSGGASASVQAVGAGTIADLWEPRERGRAMGIFYLGPLCGPLFAPIVGGLLAERWGWRSTMWFLAAYGALTVIFIFFALPETLVVRKPVLPDVPENEMAPVTRPLSRVSSRQVVGFTTRWLKMLKIIFIDPLKIVLYLQYIPVLLSVYYASIAFGSLYVLNVSVEDSFGKAPYNFSTIIIGLLYIPNSLGYVVASLFGGRWMDSIMQREAKKANRYDEKGRPIYRPEDRMRENAWLGAFLYPAALIWYGWTVDKGVFWLVPMIANFFFGIGSMLIFSMVTTMLTEFMPKKSSEGVALNNFMRNIFSCVGSLVTAPIISGIGNGWLFTILGLVSFASSSVIFLMRVFGPRWRKTMDERMR